MSVYLAKLYYGHLLPKFTKQALLSGLQGGDLHGLYDHAPGSSRSDFKILSVREPTETLYVPIFEMEVQLEQPPELTYVTDWGTTFNDLVFGLYIDKNYPQGFTICRYAERHYPAVMDNGDYDKFLGVVNQTYPPINSFVDCEQWKLMLRVDQQLLQYNPTTGTWGTTTTLVDPDQAIDCWLVDD